MIHCVLVVVSAGCTTFIESLFIFTKNLPLNKLDLLGSVLYILNIVPSIIFVGLLPLGSSVNSFIPSSEADQLFSKVKCTLSVASSLTPTILCLRVVLPISLCVNSTTHSEEISLLKKASSILAKALYCMFAKFISKTFLFAIGKLLESLNRFKFTLVS